MDPSRLRVSTRRVGLDWAEDHHDVLIQDEAGDLLQGGRLPDSIAGVQRFHEWVSDLVDDPVDAIVATETDRGLFIGALVAAGYTVLAVNPLSTSRSRERHSTSGAKSDPGDAKVLADLARTDAHNHRQVAGDSDLGEAVKVLARSHQSLIWTRQRQSNQLRSTLREFYPAAFEAFDQLTSRDALAVLAVAPSPTAGRALSKSKIAATLRRGGRQRRVDEATAKIQTALRSEQLAAPDLIAEAMAASVTALVAVIAEINTQIEQLEIKLADRFEQHPDAEIIRSLPGLGMKLGARVLAEFGDDPNRYADAKSRKNYSGMSPVWDFRLDRVVSVNASGHKFGLVYPGVGWVVWRDRDHLPEDLVFYTNYLGGPEPTMAINFSRPGSQVVAQYYNFIRLGFDGYRRIHQASQDVAVWVAGQFEQTGAFEMLTGGTDLPVLAYRFSGDGLPSEFELSERYRDRGWQVPAYTFPDNRSDLTALRIVCREGFSHDLAEALVNDTKRHLEHFRSGGTLHTGGFHH